MIHCCQLPSVETHAKLPIIGTWRLRRRQMTGMADRLPKDQWVPYPVCLLDLEFELLTYGSCEGPQTSLSRSSPFPSECGQHATELALHFLRRILRSLMRVYASINTGLGCFLLTTQPNFLLLTVATANKITSEDVPKRKLLPLTVATRP